MSVYDFFVAHSGNKHRPHVFLPSVVIGIVFVLALITLVPFVKKHISYGTPFLAAVLQSALFDETNAVRSSEHLSGLMLDATLSTIAQAKAEDMIQRGYFSHASPEGVPPWHWLDDAGYSYSYAGENLAEHFSESGDVVRAWVQSPEHYENLVKPEFTHVGFGVASGIQNGKETTIVVQFFAAKPAVPAPEQPTTLREQAITAVTPIAEAVAAPHTPAKHARDASHIVTVAAAPPPPPSLPLTTPQQALSHEAQSVKGHNTNTSHMVVVRRYNELTFGEAVYDSLDEIVLIVLFGALLVIAWIYIYNHAIHGDYILTHVTHGTAFLAGATLVLLCGVLIGKAGIHIPKDVQYASVALSLQE